MTTATRPPTADRRPTEDLPELPAGWEWTTLGEVVRELKNGLFSGSPSVEPPGIPILRISAVRQREVAFSGMRFAQRSLEEVQDYLLRDRDLLFTRYNGTLDLVGVCGLVRNLPEPVIYPDKLIRVRLVEEIILPEYVELYLSTPAPRRFIQGRAKSSAGQQGIAGKDLRQVPIPLPPLAEQRLIVERGEALLAQTRTAREALAPVSALVRQLRQAVLAAAFSGRLSEREPGDEPAGELLERIRAERKVEWEDAQLQKGRDPRLFTYQAPAAPGEEVSSDIPDHWTQTTLEQVTSAVRVICYGILMPKEHVPDGVLYVKVRDIKEDQIDLANLHRTKPEIAANYSRAALKKDDLVLSIRGTYGRVAKVPQELEGGNITQDTARLAPSKLIDLDYLAYHLRCLWSQNYLKKVARGVAVKGVNIADVRLLPIRLAPLAEQRRIVARVEALLAQVDVIEQAVAATSARIADMERAVLARAFRGELVE